VIFASFVQDVERLIDDPFAIAGRLKPLLAADGWLAREHQLAAGDACRRHVLHVSECRRLSVAALVWLPGQQTPIHEHTSWSVAGVYRGIQRQTYYSLIELNWKPCLLPAGTFEASAGHVEVVVPAAENIHSVTAVGQGKTISIHVYGADVERLSSRCYDDVPQFLPGADRRFPDAGCRRPAVV
jgi:predicted metal-dependent enzyme (double-stranded beta helix superfamily)